MPPSNSTSGCGARTSPAPRRMPPCSPRPGSEAKAEANKIVDGLDQIVTEIEGGTFNFSPKLEDIHLNIESRLKDLIGPVAGKLHTARSRNDQVATDFRLYIRDEIDVIDALLGALELALADKALLHAATIMPGFTHLQTAQPITFGHHLPGLCRDVRARPAAIRRRASGTQRMPARRGGARRHELPDRSRADIESARLRQAVGQFARRCVRSRLRARDRWPPRPSPRMHLSRLAEEIVLWTSPQFGFARLSDKFSTGSSIMPQKRNPDAAELVRAKTGRIAGAFQALLMVMKGLPLAYAKDMQEDKEPIFDALDALKLGLAAMTGMVADLEPDPGAMKRAAATGHSTATDLADWLVLELGLPFRDAHHITGRRSWPWRIARAASLKKLAFGRFPVGREAHHQGRLLPRSMWPIRSKAGKAMGGPPPPMSGGRPTGG